jgi:hypothetical protein
MSQDFVAANGWGQAKRAVLAGDASDRSYDRLTLGDKTAVLMDAPPGRGDDPAQFVAIARHLSALGLSPPAILAQDLDHGFLLIEDLGDALFARLLQADPRREPQLYADAVDVLVHLQSHRPPPGLPDLTAQDWARAAGLVLDHYCHAATGIRPDGTALTSALTDVLRAHADGPRVMILRDYHAENLLHLPGRSGVAAVGLLDFQLGQMGQPGYDLVSLLQDARRDVTPAVAQQMIARFATARGLPPDQFHASYAVLGAQRALRILGIFARLCLQAGKPGYLRLMPRVWDQLQDNLAHPALAVLKRVCDETLPAPTPALLQKIGDQCASRSP